MKKLLFIALFTLFACFSFNVNAESISVTTPTIVISEADGIGKNYNVVFERINNEPTPSGQKTQKLTIKGNKEGSFGTITFTEPGYYYYKIYQTDTNDSKINYDTRVYDYIIQISTEEGGVLRSAVSLKVSGDSEKSTVASFVNSLKNKESNPGKAVSHKTKKRRGVNPYTGDIIVKYFIVSIVSIILILLMIIYIKKQRSSD